MVDYCYEFGRALAHFRTNINDLTMEFVLDHCQSSGLAFSCGSNGTIRAIIGAFDEFKRLQLLQSQRAGETSHEF